MSLISKKSIAPFVLMWVFALVDTGDPPARVTGFVIGFAAVFVGIVISDAATQLVAELREARRGREQSKIGEGEESNDKHPQWMNDELHEELVTASSNEFGK